MMLAVKEQSLSVYADVALINFIVSVVASVAGHFICKWLDRHSGDS